ncbi:MAG: LamG domain-containing protein, partial [Clostridia bacterium]|nr:LamG domain-containing protein [Clostridia bacterium]
NNLPVAESFVLKVITKDKKGLTAEISKTINRENRVPTVTITNYPTNVHKREDNLSFKITVSDLDKRIDPVLTTNIELDGRKVSEADFEISPAVSVSNDDIPAINGTTYQVTIKKKTKYISIDTERFTLNVKTKDTCGATNNKSITINNINTKPRITLSKTELSLADGKIPKHDQTFSFKITASDSDTIDQNLKVKFYIIIDGKSTEVTTFKAGSQNITDGNLIATKNQTYTITIDKTIPAENPLIPNTVNNFTLKAEVTDDLFSTDDDQIELIHFNTPPEIEVLGLTTDVSNTVRKSDNILSFGLILKDKDAADTEIKCEMYVKVLDTEQKVNQFTVDAITNNTGTLTGQNGKKYEITLNKAVFVPMFASDFSIKFVATDTCGDKIEEKIFFTHYTDIIAQWALDSVKDNVAVDSGGQSNNGIVHGATLTTGIIGYGYSFDGTNDYVEVPLSPTLSGAITTNSFSVETWVKTTDTPSRNIGLVTNYGTNTTPFWKLGLEGASKKFHFELRDKQGNYATVAAPTALNDGNWHHLVGVRDAEQGKIRLYVDGVLVGEKAAPPGDVNSGQSIFFGFHSNRYFQGCLDEVTLYGCALSAEEVRKNYGKIVYLTDLTMTNRYDDESTHPCT